MGVYTHDGMLLGIVSKRENLPPDIDQDGIISYLENVIKLSRETDAEAVCFPNEDASEDWYIGIFWPASERRIMAIDDQWKPLFLLKADSDKITTDDKLRLLRQRIFENLASHLPHLKIEDIKLYEARYFS